MDETENIKVVDDTQSEWVISNESITRSALHEIWVDEIYDFIETKENHWFFWIMSFFWNDFNYEVMNRYWIEKPESIFYVLWKISNNQEITKEEWMLISNINLLKLLKTYKECLDLSRFNVNEKERRILDWIIRNYRNILEDLTSRKVNSILKNTDNLNKWTDNKQKIHWKYYISNHWNNYEIIWENPSDSQYNYVKKWKKINELDKTQWTELLPENVDEILLMSSSIKNWYIIIYKNNNKIHFLTELWTQSDQSFNKFHKIIPLEDWNSFAILSTKEKDTIVDLHTWSTVSTWNYKIWSEKLLKDEHSGKNWFIIEWPENIKYFIDLWINQEYQFESTWKVIWLQEDLSSKVHLFMINDNWHTLYWIENWIKIPIPNWSNIKSFKIHKQVNFLHLSDKKWQHLLYNLETSKNIDKNGIKEIIWFSEDEIGDYVEYKQAHSWNKYRRYIETEKKYKKWLLWWRLEKG